MRTSDGFDAIDRHDRDRRGRVQAMSSKSAIFALGLIAATALAGCATESSIIENILVVPGYYDTLGCPELVAQVNGSAARIKELTGLMDKSSGNPAGPVVNALAYNTDYAKARATQKYAEDAARRKSCDLTKKVETAAPTGPPPAAKPIDLGMPSMGNPGR
jgi:hypothetical protein